MFNANSNRLDSVAQTSLTDSPAHLSQTVLTREEMVQHSAFPSPKLASHRAAGLHSAAQEKNFASQPLTAQVTTTGSGNHRRGGSRASWQFLVGPQRSLDSLLSVHRTLQNVIVRADAASTYPESHLSWTETVVESSLPWGAFSSNKEDSGSTELIASQNNRAELESAKVSTEARALTDEFSVRNVLHRAANDVLPPIAAARTLLKQVSEDLKISPSEDSAQSQLQQVDDYLRLASTWATGLLIENNLERQGRTIRKRFYPEQWRAEIAPLLESIAEDHGVKLVWVGWDRSLPRLYADHRHLSRAILNLVTDAIEASPRGGEVQIDVAWQTNVTPRISFSVVDHRRILTQAMSSAINRFDEEESCGILGPTELSTGILIAKNLIESSGGSLSVQSDANTGSSFRFSLPVDTCQATIRTWLSSQRTTDHDAPRLSVYVYAIGIQGIESVAFDEQLQRHASKCDLVYRIGDRRWLWFVLTDKDKARTKDDISSVMSSVIPLIHPEGSENARYFIDEVLGVPFLGDGNWQATQPEFARTYVLARRLADGLQSLMAKHVPPIDELRKYSLNAHRKNRPSVPADNDPLIGDINQRLASIHAKHLPIRTPHFGLSSGSAREDDTNRMLACDQTQNSQSCPIEADVANPAQLVALQEIAEQWRFMQKRLEGLHGRLRQIALNPMV